MVQVPGLDQRHVNPARVGMIQEHLPEEGEGPVNPARVGEWENGLCA